MADNVNTIVLKGKGHHDEGEADAAISPGEAVRLAADGNYDPETLAAQVAAGRGLKLAKENALEGETVDNAYADGDVLFFYSPIPGDHVHVLVKAGEDIDVGDYLSVEGSGSGQFTEVSSSGTAEYKLPVTQAKVHDDLATGLPSSLAVSAVTTAFPVNLTDARIHDAMDSLLPASLAVSAVTTAFPVALTDARIHDAMDDFLPATAANDDMAIVTGTPGTDAPTLQGVDFGGAATDEACAFELVLPDDYVDGEAVTVRVRAAMLTTVSDGTATVDVEAFETDNDGAVGSDICATAAQSINSLTSADLDFTITPTALVAGDTIIVRLTFGGSDTGNAGVMIPEISAVDLRVITTAAVTAPAAGDDMAIITGTPGTDAPTLQGGDFGATTSDEKCAFALILPDDYVAAGAVTVRVRAAVLTTVADTSLTLDVEAFETDGDGAVGSDICATAAQSMNSLTPANLDFTITATNLVAGDTIIVRLSFAGTDSGDAGAMIPEISAASLRVLTTAAVTATAAGDDMVLVTGTPGTDAPTIQGADFGATTSNERCAFEFVLPQEYRAAAAVTLRVKAGILTTVADASLTLDAEVWEDAGDGTVGSDICATAAQSVNSLTMANKDFTITPTGLVAGDRLIVRLTFAGVDSGDLGAMTPEIQNVALRIGNAVAGQLEALEDSGGALAAATLIRCRVLNP